MTLTTILIVNLVLDGLATFGVVRLLHHGIHLDRRARLEYVRR